MHPGMSHGTKQGFLREERLPQSEQRVVDEKRCHADMVAETKCLRELRLARDAAKQEASAVRKP